MSELEGLFEFELPDGAKVEMSIHRARSLGCKNITKRCDEIVEYYKSKAKKKHKKDGFVPGWQENIRMYISCPFQYRRALKELGLVEIGNDSTPHDSTKTSNPFSNDAMIKAAVDSGIYLSGREIDALKSGDYFKGLPVVDEPENN